MPPVASVLVLGAGELGLAVLKALASKSEDDFDVTVLLRPSTAELSPVDSKISSIYALPRPIKILPCDLVKSSQSELTETFKPFHVIIGCIGYDQNSTKTGSGLQLKIAKAVFGTSTVKLYIPWQFGVDYDLFNHETAGGLFSEQKDVRVLLRNAVDKRETNTNWIIISTGIFMSFLFQDFWGVARRDESGGLVVNALGSWDTAVSVTTPDDIGRLTAEIIVTALGSTPEAEELRNSAVFIAGDTVTYAELFEVVQHVSQGSVVKGSVFTMDMLEEKLLQNPDDVLCKYRVAFGRGKGVSWDRAATFNFKHDIEVQDVKSWLQDHNMKK